MVEQLEPRPLAPVGERGAALVGDPVLVRRHGDERGAGARDEGA